MTNAEKFKSVFGVDFFEFDTNDLSKTYGKQKRYKAVQEKWNYKYENFTPITVYVNASSLKEARVKAIEKLGDKYIKFHSGRPAYKLTVTVAR